jgi:hypothetical protein
MLKPSPCRVGKVSFSKLHEVFGGPSIHETRV